MYINPFWIKHFVNLKWMPINIHARLDGWNRRGKDLIFKYENMYDGSFSAGVMFKGMQISKWTHSFRRFFVWNLILLNPNFQLETSQTDFCVILTQQWSIFHIYIYNLFNADSYIYYIPSIHEIHRNLCIRTNRTIWKHVHILFRRHLCDLFIRTL